MPAVHEWSNVVFVRPFVDGVVDHPVHWRDSSPRDDAGSVWLVTLIVEQL